MKSKIASIVKRVLTALAWAIVYYMKYEYIYKVGHDQLPVK